MSFLFRVEPEQLSSSSALRGATQGGLIGKLLPRSRSRSKHCCHWATEIQQTDVCGERIKAFNGLREERWKSAQTGVDSLCAAVLISISHFTASLLLQSAASIYYHLTGTFSSSLRLCSMLSRDSWIKAACRQPEPLKRRNSLYPSQ